ncbi:MAG TPA: aminoacyl--tRNA ligase-related protein [Actinospica sp.]|nr:aminoacyl--tRNA ligase-related protein [Actinospica sp.]
MSTNTETAHTRDGLATIGPHLIELRTALDERFTAWAAQCGAAPYLYPPLMRVDDLRRFDYFQNFPHLAILGAPLSADAQAAYAKGGDEATAAVPAADLDPAGYALPSAACYNVYLGLSGRQLAAAERVTTVATCFRREKEYDGLNRLLGFTMREIVCVGTRDEVLDHLGGFKKLITGFLADLGLPVEVQAASDPFFDPNASRAVVAQLFPTKEEFVFDGSLAIGSLNFHRNFFGERCEIGTADGPAFTGCVAFGIERWISALTRHFGEGPLELADRVRP